MQVVLDSIAAFFASFSPADRAVDSRRLFHGRGQCYPGLEFVCVDYFQPVLLITCFQEPPAGFSDALLAQLKTYSAPGVLECVLIQHRYREGAPAAVLLGDLPDETFAVRGGLRFQLSLMDRQNTGFFLDMEPGRQWLERVAKDRKILNLFAYTCAFSVVGVAAGAARVVNVDMSRRALETGRHNHRLNGLPDQRSEFMAENILKSWGRIRRRGPYDIVIIDPPSYQPGSFIATKDYARVVRRLPELMPGGGLVLACLNAPEVGADFLAELMKSSCPGVKLLERLPGSPDFPDADINRQLKLMVFECPAISLPAEDGQALSSPPLQ